MVKTEEKKKIGRPMGSFASKTLEAHLQREILVHWLKPKLNEIFHPQLVKARQGDTAAFNALLDRAWGKPAQSITGGDGKDLFPGVKEKTKANDALDAFLVKTK